METEEAPRVGFGWLGGFGALDLDLDRSDDLHSSFRDFQQSS